MDFIHMLPRHDRTFFSRMLALAILVEHSVQDSRLIGCSHEDNAAVVH